MYKSTLFIFILTAASFLISAEEFRYSAGDLTAVISEYENLTGFSREAGQEFTLLELLPLMEEVHSLVIKSSAGETLVSEEDLAEEWGESRLFMKGGAPGLLFRDTEYSRIESLQFSGTALDSGTLEIWVSWEGTDELKQEIQKFAGNHGFTAKTLEVPSPDAKLISVVRARGPVPDLVMIQSSAVEKLTQSRAVQSLDYIHFRGLIPQGRRAFTLDGKLWGMPFYFDTQVLFYNRNLVTGLTPDHWTLADMENAARRLKTRGVHPLVWNAYSSNWLIPFQISFGKNRLVENDGSIRVDDEPTLRSLQYILGLQNEGLMVPMERDAMDALFISGKVGMILSGSYAIPYFQSLNLNFGVLPFPVNQQTGRRVSSLLDFKAFCMTRQTKNPVLARRLLQHLYGRALQQRFSSQLNKLSVREMLLRSGGALSEYGPVLEMTVDSGTVIPPEGIYGVYKNNMWKLIRFALTGQMSPEQTLVQGQRLMDANQR